MKHSKRARIAPLLLVACLACNGGVPTHTADGAARDAALTIKADELYQKISALAHDSMRGRDTPSSELDAAAEWVARALEDAGLTPAFGTDGFVQRYAIQRVVQDFQASSVTTSNGVEISFASDLGVPFGPADDSELRGSVVVLVGAARDAALRPDIELTGRHVVVVASGASATRRSLLELVQSARASGSLSVWVADPQDDEAWSRDIALQERNARVRVGTGSDAAPVFSIREASLERLLAPSGFDLGAARADDGRSSIAVQEFPEVQVSLRPRLRVIEEHSAPNVAGVLPGSDAALGDEQIVFSAHLDHVGVGSPDATGDSIHNGADDDASGSAVILELAEAFASLPLAPRRSVTFLWVSGEEKGLWGSGYFTQHPHVPIDRIVANLNADMVGRNWTDTIVAIGKEHSDLGRTLDAVNEAHSELGITAIDDIWPEENFYSRSDHFNFARRGVPVLFFFNGTHDDYHRPSDELEKIDTEKAARIGRLMFYLGLQIANEDEAPRWNPDSFRRIVAGG
jgi:hypothetical protein